jgi:membrane protease YdiL (CAAX protease family)
VRPLVWPVIVAFFGALVGIQILGGIVGVVALLAYGAKLKASSVSEILNKVVENPKVIIASVVFSEAVLLVVTFVGLGLAKAQPRQRLRLGPASTSAVLFIPMILGTLAVSEAGDALLALTHVHASFSLPAIAGAIRGSSPLEFAILLAMAGVLAPVAEEIFFRGFMQTRLVERWGRWRGILFAAACFGILHFDPVHTPLAFAMGIVLGWVVEISGSIRSSILAHAVNNLIALIGTRLLGDDAGEGLQLRLLAVSVGVGTLCFVALSRVERSG